MKRKFPLFSSLGESALRKISGYVSRDEMIKQAKAYQNELSELTDDALSEAVATEYKIETNAIAEKIKSEEDARFFNAPGSNAYFEHWAKASYWSLEEAVALSFGKEPSVVYWDRIKPLTQVSGFAYQFGRLRDLALRAKGTGQLFDPVLPGIYIAWTKRVEIQFPAELEQRVKDFGGVVTDWQELYEAEKVLGQSAIEKLLAQLKSQKESYETTITSITEMAQGLAIKQREAMESLSKQLHDERAKNIETHQRPLQDRERGSLLKLIIGMAIDSYGYDPKSSRSTTAKEIAYDLVRTGLTLDEDTIRKYLQMAREVLPPDVTEQGGH